MEKFRNIHLCSVFALWVFLLFSSSSPVTSRSLTTEITETVVLDVSASAQKTLEVLSSNPQIFQQQEQELEQAAQSSSSSSSGFNLQMHSRDTFQKSQYKDYEALTLARLKRDSARVRSLNANLDRAIKAGIKNSDLEPFEEGTRTEGLEGPIVSGLSQGSGEYFSRIEVGSPPNPLYMVLDTGSDVTWVQCQPCQSCYPQTDPIFDPTKSSSYVPLSCDSAQCKSLERPSCQNASCGYEVLYGDGSSSSGDFGTETLTFQNSGSVSKFSIGCGHDNEGLFIGAAGIMGLGGGDLSFPSQLKTSSFSYCLVDRDSSASSSLQFGSSDESAVTSPLIRNPKMKTFYYLDLTGISVAGKPLQIPPSYFKLDESTGTGGVIIDSGTAVTRLRGEVYVALRDAFRSGTTELPSAPAFALFDTCYDLSSKSTIQVPTVVFHFSGGSSLSLPPKNYLIPVDTKKTFCFAFATTRSTLSIVGNLQQQGTRVGYDIGNSVIKFSVNKC